MPVLRLVLLADSSLIYALNSLYVVCVFYSIQIIGGFGSFQHNANPPKAAVVASPSAGPTPHLQPSVWSWAGGAGGINTKIVNYKNPMYR